MPHSACPFQRRLIAAAIVTFISHAALAHEEVVITDKAIRAHEKLTGDIVATEALSLKDITKTGAITLTEVLDKRPGIAMQTECSVCNVRNIVLNNLPGRYTTLLIDGIPIFSSVSTAYGLDSVNLGGIERIDIARGAGASLIAPEALAGSVNIVSRRPSKDELQLDQQFGHFGQASTSLFAAQVTDGGALTANATLARHNGVDADGNGISEYAAFQRQQIGLGYFVDDVAGFKLRGRLDVVHERRNGGTMGNDVGAIKADSSGNPFDWSKGINASPAATGWIDPASGSVLAYDSGHSGFAEIISTDRTQWISSATRRFGAGTLRLAYGHAEHKQDSFYEATLYKATQQQDYLEASTQQPWLNNIVTLGASYRYEDLRSLGSAPDGTRNDGLDNYRYRTPGLFVQLDRPMLNDQLELNAALRWDKHNVFGNILSPRFNLLWKHDSQLASRFSLGKGYRAPTSFFEQDHGILETTRIVREISRPEESRNASYTLAYASDRLSWTASANWNRISNMAMLDPNALDPITGDAITLFTAATTPVTTQGADLNLSYKLTPALEGTLGLELTHYDFQPGTLTFARPESKVFLSLDYEADDWDLYAKASWTGSQDLARFYDYANNPRYNLNGTAKMNRSPAFWLLDLHAAYQLSEQWSVYLGVDNATNFRQIDQENFLWVDGAGNTDTTQLWGPNRGRFIYGGVKFAL